jgi:galactose mutarotase-like enzyme
MTHPDDWLRITSGALTAAINPFGAELSSLTDADGRELMTDADPAFWTGRAPILFPVVGAVSGGAIRVDGTEYPMRKHGLARHSRFTVAEHAADRLVLRLADSAETRAEYPFAFVLELAFALAGTTLSITARIGNPGTADLPASFGFHPAFAWPLPYGRAREAHQIVFDRPEPAPLRRLDADGLIAPDPRSSPLDGATLHLSDDLFTADALIWDRLGSQALTYGAPDGLQLRVAFPDTPYLGIWTKTGSRFICIEPWHGIADPQGFAGAFRDKPGVFLIPPGGERRIAMEIALLA